MVSPGGGEAAVDTTIAFAKRLPFSKLRAGKQDIGGHRVEVNEPYRVNCLNAIDSMVAML